MKPFWDNYFFDMREGGITDEEFSDRAGAAIRMDLDAIERFIRELEPKKALERIAEMKREL